MITSALFLILCAVVPGDGPAFALRDEAEVDGRPVVQFRAVELRDEPSRPVEWAEPPPDGTRFGLARVGRSPESGLAVAWDAASRSLWVDADADGRLGPDERIDLGSGEEHSITITIVDEDDAKVERVLLVRPGLLGGGPRWAVRGVMEGDLMMGGEPRKALLVDGDADGCFGSPGADRAWIDLDGDGRFDPATEQFPLGAPIKVGETSYTIASDPWARSVRVVERDNRVGRLILTLGPDAIGTEVEHISAQLINRSGELATIRRLGEAVEVPVGPYRLSTFELTMKDDRGRAWIYTFSGGWEETIVVEPGGTTEAALIAGLGLDVRAFSHLAVRPGGSVDVTPRLVLGSGMYLSNCTAARPGARSPDGRTATIVLRAPDGSALDQSVSGFS